VWLLFCVDDEFVRLRDKNTRYSEYPPRAANKTGMTKTRNSSIHPRKGSISANMTIGNYIPDLLKPADTFCHNIIPC